MGLFDDLNKMTSSVNKGVSSVRSAQNAAKGAKSLAEDAGKLLAAKCKKCQQPLKTDLEKKKGICANCALAAL